MTAGQVVESNDQGAHWRLFRAFDLLRALHQTFYDQVKTADQKAGYVCTFLTILFAYSKEQGHVLLFLNMPPSWSVPWILSLCFAAAAGFSVVCTALVILPRGSPRGTSEPSHLYWGAWIGSPITKEQLLDKNLDDFLMSEYLRDIQNLARICQAKYKFVNLAFRGTAVAMLCYFSIIILAK